MQAEDAERNPSNWMSREIAVKVNNELQQPPPPPTAPPPPLLLLLLFLLLPELLETCSQLPREQVNFPLPGFNPQASPHSRLICGWLGAGLTLWAEPRQERGRGPGEAAGGCPRRLGAPGAPLGAAAGAGSPEEQHLCGGASPFIYLFFIYFYF